MLSFSFMFVSARFALFLAWFNVFAMCLYDFMFLLLRCQLRLSLCTMSTWAVTLWRACMQACGGADAVIQLMMALSLSALVLLMLQCFANLFWLHVRSSVLSHATCAVCYERHAFLVLYWTSAALCRILEIQIFLFSLCLHHFFLHYCCSALQGFCEFVLRFYVRFLCSQVRPLLCAISAVFFLSFLGSQAASCRVPEVPMLSFSLCLHHHGMHFFGGMVQGFCEFVLWFYVPSSAMSVKTLAVCYKCLSDDFVTCMLACLWRIRCCHSVHDGIIILCTIVLGCFNVFANIFWLYSEDILCTAGRWFPESPYTFINAGVLYHEISKTHQLWVFTWKK